MPKKPVSSSHLAIRFYKGNGWTEEILRPYLICGSLRDTSISHGDSPEWAYLSLNVGSRLDMKRLLENEISEVGRWYDGPPRESDLEYLQKLNW